MSIVTTVSTHEFERAFVDMGREDSFSRQGLQALQDYLEELSDDIGEPIELDVIGLCGDFSEYDIADVRDEFAEHYDDFPEENDEYGDDEDEIVEWLQYHTTAIPFDRIEVVGGRMLRFPAVIVQDF